MNTLVMNGRPVIQNIYELLLGSIRFLGYDVPESFGRTGPNRTEKQECISPRTSRV